MTQGALATIAGRSVHSIRAIEQGKFGINERTAEQISRLTGVSSAWLLDDSPDFGQPVDEHGREITAMGVRAHFLAVSDESEEIKSMQRSPMLLAFRLQSALEKAETRRDYASISKRVSKFLDELEQEFKASESKKEDVDQETKAAGSAGLSRKTTEKIRQLATGEGLAQAFAPMPETMTHEGLVQAIIDNAQSPVTAEEALGRIKANPKAVEALEDLEWALQHDRRPKPTTFGVLIGTIKGYPGSKRKRS